MFALKGLKGLKPLVRHQGQRRFLPSDLSGLVLWLDAERSRKWQDAGRTTPVANDADPVGAWDDLSGNGLHFLASSGSTRPTWRAGPPRVAFDGTDDRLGRDSAAALGFTGEYTAAILLNRNNVAGNRGLLYRGDSSKSEIEIYVSGNSLVLVHNRDASNNVGCAALVTAPAPNSLRHLVVTYKELTWRVYVNGSLQNTVTVDSQGGGGPLENPDAEGMPWLIGFNAHAQVGSSPYAGSMRQVVLYNRALSDAEVLALYQSTGANA